MAPACRVGTRPPAPAAHPAPLSGHLLLSVLSPPPSEAREPQRPPRPGPRSPRSLPFSGSQAGLLTPPPPLSCFMGSRHSPKRGVPGSPRLVGRAYHLQPRTRDSTGSGAQLRRAHLVRSSWGGDGETQFNSSVLSVIPVPFPQTVADTHPFHSRMQMTETLAFSRDLPGPFPLLTIQDVGFSSSQSIEVQPFTPFSTFIDPGVRASSALLLRTQESKIPSPSSPRLQELESPTPSSH